MHDDRCAWISPGQLGCCALKVQISFKLCETEAAFGGAALNLSDTAVRQFCAQPQQECRPSCAMMQRLVDSLPENSALRPSTALADSMASLIWLIMMTHGLLISMAQAGMASAAAGAQQGVWQRKTPAWAGAASTGR